MNYAERHAEAEDEYRRTRGVPPGAFVSERLFRENVPTKGRAESLALALIREHHPRACSISVPEVVVLIAEALEQPTS